MSPPATPVRTIGGMSVGVATSPDAVESGSPVVLMFESIDGPTA